MVVFFDCNNIFIVQTGASSAGAGAVPLQTERHGEQVLTFGSHCVLKTDSRRRFLIALKATTSSP